MKKLLVFLLIIIVIILSIPVILFAQMGFVPGLSSFLGTNKPKDLGIKYTAKDLASCRGKSQLKYQTIPDNPNPKLTIQFSGERKVKTEFTSQDITATMNNQGWKYWPYSNVQVKFNADGTAEVSGIFLKDRLVGYGQTISAPKQAIDFVQKYLPGNFAFYLKGKAALKDNKLSTFNPTGFEIGRMPMPLNLFLSMGGVSIIKSAYAQSMEGELSKVSGKKQMIIDFINQRLASDYGKFYANSAYFGDNKLYFDGTLNESISYSH